MSESSASLVGSTIAGKFLIEELLGSGSMGQVYRARHLQLEQTIALKVMSNALAAEPSFAARFEREARASFALAHPNVIRVIDYGRDAAGSGITYLAMEYVSGGDLASLIYRSASLPPKRIALLMRQALAGIAAAHDAGVIHRDLKPENIMIAAATDDDGQVSDLVKVCDFGIAKLSDATTDSQRFDPGAHGKKRLTEVGLVIGTPEYMSPEQGRGDVVDARSDIYAMGVVLYELLTGDLPFTATTAVATVMKQISEEPIRPSHVRPDVDPQLEEVCLKALRKSPDARFQSAREMRVALGTAIGLRESGQSIPPVPSSRGGKPTETALSIGNDDIRTAATLIMREPLAAPASRWSRLTQSKLFMAAAGAVVVLVAASASSRMLRRAEPLAAASGARLRDDGPAAPAAATIASTASDAPEAPSARLDQAASALPPAMNAPKIPATLAVSKVSIAEAGAAPSPSSPSPLASVSPASPALRSAPTGDVPSLVAEAPSAVAPVASPATPAILAPAPSSSPLAPAPAEPTFDPSAARATIRGIDDVQGARKSDVQNALTRLTSRLVTCYQNDLRAAPRPSSGTGVLHIETDDSGTVTSAHANAPLSANGARCIERAVMGVKIQNVDTGQAQADVAISFELR